MPSITSADDAAEAMAAILAAVADGGMTPIEAGEVAKLIETYTRTLEATEFEARLKNLEEKADDK